MLEFKDVSFTYKNSNNKVLDRVNFKINKGECILLIGVSGSGKSTLIHLMNGLIPTLYEGQLEGEILFKNKDLKDIESYDISKNIGYVSQDPRGHFFTTNTTSELVFSMENYGIPLNEMKKKYSELVNLLELEKLVDKNIIYISSGERQKIAIGCSLSLEPEIIILDEPSSNLDIQTIGKLKDTIRKWKEKKATIIIAEHRLRYLIDIADKFIYMKDGQIHTIFTNEEFKRLSNDILNNMGLRSINPVNFKDLKNFIKVDSKINIKNFEFSYNKTPFLNIKNTLLPQNAIIAVLGSNGSGKSTFSKCLCGVEEKAKGVLEIETDTYSTRERLRKCFMVMQDVNHQLFTESVKEEILLSIEDNENEEQMVKEICKKLNLMEFLDCHPMSLSGGQKQRVAIASAIASNREILVLDEPTSGLDFKNMKEVSNEMIRLKESGKTIFIITHDPELVACCCDYYMFLENGKVKWHGVMNEENLKLIEKFFYQKSECL